jgi:hypothetical protein
LRVDGSGNLGLGVTPSAWGSGSKALEGAYGAALSWSTGGAELNVESNAYYNGTNWIYKTSAYATMYSSAGYNGKHSWYTAPSGTAGNAITFTQAMTLNASNQLMIGTTAPSTFPYLTVANTGVDVQVISTTTTSALMDANATNNILALRAPFSASPATATNFGAKWGIWFSGGPPSDTTTYPYSSTQARTTVISKSAAIYAVSEDPGAGYNRTVGLAFYTSAFDAGMTQSARFDGRGNFAVGMTPSPWGSGRTAIQVYGSSTAAYFSGGTANGIFGNNFYHNGTNDVFTNATWYAAYYAQDYLGNHSWASSTAASTSANSAVTFNTLMYLTQAGNLGIGTTSPTGLLTLNKASGAYGLNLDGGGYGTLAQFGIVNVGTNNNSFIGSISNNDFLIKTYNSTVATFDTSGNLGLGVTPSAFGTGWGKAVQVNRVSLAGDINAGMYLSTNFYYDGATSRYIASNYATQMASYNGTFLWNLAASGTAGNAISFTQAMTLDTSGNLLVGTTSANSARVNAKAFDSAGNYFALYTKNSSDTALFSVRSDGYLLTGVAANSPYNATTAYAGNVFVQTDGGLYRSTSSLRYKTDVQNAVHGLAELMKLRPVTYKGKNDGDKVFGGLIAEEVHDAGLAEFVLYDLDSNPDAIFYGPMVSLCIKAMQEQQALIESLTARLNSLENK